LFGNYLRIFVVDFALNVLLQHINFTLSLYNSLLRIDIYHF
jgi:hypothetical protein